MADDCRQRFRVDPNVAEEIAQDVLLKLLKEMQKFRYRADKSFRRWLKTVTPNAFRTYYRFPITMKKQSELVVITKTYDLIPWSCKHTSRFPRKYRFVLGERIDQNQSRSLSCVALISAAKRILTRRVW